MKNTRSYLVLQSSTATEHKAKPPGQARAIRWISHDFGVGGSGVAVRKQDDRREDCIKVDGDAFSCIIAGQSLPMELRKMLPLSKLEGALPNNLLGTGGMTSVSLCFSDLLCFSLQCFHPSDCCDRFTEILESMAEDTSVRTGGS